ncbi:hypothetical protein FGO68_gene7897 [Halteria grandinella]|uniref:RING-type domain-containing protein n=1 Tax=Halteria grandinella TaxID=5974 RepID=A0A8J8NS00_HALGN|nr:hypothetical protein FGO68_gene7897 [Halteria grandinella]
MCIVFPINSTQHCCLINTGDLLKFAALVNKWRCVTTQPFNIIAKLLLHKLQQQLMNNFPPLLIDSTQQQVSGPLAPTHPATDISSLADSLIQTIRKYRATSIRAFLLLFVASIAQIMVFGLLIQAFVIRLIIYQAMDQNEMGSPSNEMVQNAEERIRRLQIEEQYENFSSNMNAAAYSSVLMDIFFFMLQQKSLEFSTGASLTWQCLLYKYRWLFSLCFLLTQFILNSTVLYFATKITLEIAMQRSFTLNLGNISNILLLGLMVVYMVTRIVLFGTGQLIVQRFWLRQVKILYKLTRLPFEWRIQALGMLENGEEQERRSNEHVELMNKIPKIDAKDFLSKVHPVNQDKQNHRERRHSEETNSPIYDKLNPLNNHSPSSKLSEIARLDNRKQDSPQKYSNMDTPKTKFLKEKSCIICLEGIYDSTASSLGSQELAPTKQREVCVLSCNGSTKACSFYHRECLSDWLQTKRVCPLCRDGNFVNTHILENSDQEETKDQLRKKQSVMKRLCSHIFAGPSVYREQSSFSASTTSGTQANSSYMTNTSTNLRHQDGNLHYHLMRI